MSLGILAVVGLFGATACGSDDGDDGLDVVLSDPQDRTISSDGIPTNASVEGEPMPIVEVSDGDGTSISTASFLGADPIVVNFWFSTCPPCAKELPDFAEVDAETDDVRFIGINTIDSVPVMERFAGERGVTYDLFRDDLAEFTDGIGATNFPVTIFVTSDGTIVEQAGVLDADELRAKVNNLRDLEAA